MSRISKPVDWEVYNIPPVQQVQYYSTLKKRREFSQLLKQYDHVSKLGYLHYCSIVPKNISLSLKSSCEIIIVFFDEIPATSCIGFRVKANKRTFKNESNSLLLFLKESNKATFYIMHKNFINVQCASNAWELFYLLYDNFLQKYAWAIIGTQFYYNFVYSRCIQLEKQLLEAIYIGSRYIKVSRNSVFYKLGRQRKVSILDIIHMIMHMPPKKKYMISYYVDHATVYSATGNIITVSKLKTTKEQLQSTLSDDRNQHSVTLEEIPAISEPAMSAWKSNRQLSSSNSTFKRKFEEIENSKHYTELGPSTSKLFKNSDSSSIKDQWEQHQNLKPYNIKCYSGISCIKNLVPKLLKNGKTSEFFHSNPYFMNFECGDSVLPCTKLNNTENVQKVEFSKEIDLNSCNPTVPDKNTSFLKFKKPFGLETSTDSVPSKNISFNLQKCDESCEPGLDISDVDNYCKPAAPRRSVKNVSQGPFVSVKDENFTTASGKAINVSDTAMLTAHKFIQDVIKEENQKALHERDPNKTCDKTSFRNIYPDFKKKAVTEHITLPKISVNKPSHGIKIFKDNENSAKKFETVLPSKVDENLSLDNFATIEDIDFSTAAGKTLQVSNTSMQAAYKLLKDVFDEGNKPSSSRGINLDKKNYQEAIKDIGYSTKKLVDEEVDMDVDMDNTLVEKFFEDTLFDEKELESATENKRDENLDSALVSNSDKNLPSRKVRKSLGGRRSIRRSSKQK